MGSQNAKAVEYLATEFTRLPATFIGHRIFVQPVTSDDVQLTFYTDTGGGGMFIEPATVHRLGLPVMSTEGESIASESVAFPAFHPDASIPRGRYSDQLAVVAAPYRDTDVMRWDGFLGHSWFADRVWKFDYLQRQLAYRTDLGWEIRDHMCPLGFKTDDTGKRPTAFPRITAMIDGETRDFLLDTGAMVQLTAAAQASAVLADGPPIRGTSFVTHSLFEVWRTRHPDWRVVENADAYGGEAMIQVPVVHLAGYGVGPVWFTRRSDANFHEYLSQWMDQRVDGALGGSVFQYFTMVVDYRRARAYFSTTGSFGLND